MSQIAKVAVSSAIYAIDKPYSYVIPEGMNLSSGQRVLVPFGRGNRVTEGMVLSAEPGPQAELKCILQVLDPEPVLDEQMLRLAAFVRERYFCTFYEAVRVTLPAGLWFDLRDNYKLAEGTPWEGKTVRQKDALRILEELQNLGGAGDYPTLRKCFEEEDRLRAGLCYLLNKKWITSDTDFLRRAGDKTERIAVLSASAEEVMEYARRQEHKAPVQFQVLQMLSQLGTCGVKELYYYTGATAATLRRLEKLGYLELQEQPVLRCREIRPAKISGPLVLNEEQEMAYERLLYQMDQEQPGTALLYGVTGSGKTAVYLKLIEECLRRDQSVLLMVPEIALTPQLLSLLSAYFGKQVAVLHSSLPAGERYDQWKRVKNGEARVVVGTRSAVFAPCKNLGLIILDEEQEHSYKSEQSPRYCAKEVAQVRGIRQKVLVLFGSATPSIETMYRAQVGDYVLCQLHQRYNGHELPQVQIVDMKEELLAGNDTGISSVLETELRETVGRGEQAILFLNRRGNSRMLQCVQCGAAPTCPRCSVALTYHSVNHRLMCHYCGYSEPVPSRCPECDGPLKSIGMGTQKIQDQLKHLLPGAAVIRMDADTVSAANPHEKILQRFQEEKIPILLGTQMVAKGLDLPNVTLVGVLDADLSLYVENYRAAETTFNMLTQVVGRAGRGTRSGRAVIQTMTPQHQVITLAAEQNYDQFFQTELTMRKLQGCPPFSDIYVVTFVGPEEGRVLESAAWFRDSLKQWIPQYPGLGVQVLGPAPAAVAKVNYNFRYRLTLRSNGGRTLRQLIGTLLRCFGQDRRNRGVSAFADINGYD